MTTDPGPPTRRRNLQALIEQLEGAGNVEQAFIQLVLHDASQKDPELPSVLRACALPRRFDATIVGVLREAPDDSQRNEALFDLVRAHRFVLRRDDGGCVYHDNTRDALLVDWQSTPEKRAEFARLNRQLATFYTESFANTRQAEQDLNELAVVMRQANQARYLSLVATIEARMSAQLVEALYHRLLESPSDGISFLGEQLYELEAAEHVALCQTLIRVARDFFERLGPDQRNVHDVNWLDYYEAHLVRLARPHDLDVAERTLRELSERPDLDGEERLWVLDDLAQVYDATSNYPAAFQTRLELVQLYETTSADVQNAPVWYLTLGGLHARLLQWDEAIRRYQTALELSESKPDVRSDSRVSSRHALSDVYRTRGEWSKAFEFANEALYLARTIFPNIAWMQRAIALQFANLVNKFDAAAADSAAEEALAHLPPFARARVDEAGNYASMLLLAGRLNAAEERIQTLLREVEGAEYRAETAPLLLLYQGLIHESRGRLDEAVACYDATISATSGRADMLDVAAVALLRRGGRRKVSGDWHEAETDIVQSIRFWETSTNTAQGAWARVSLADLMRVRGLTAEAAQQLDEAATVLLPGPNEDAAELYLCRGKLFLSQGQWAQALESFEKGLQVSRDYGLRSMQVTMLQQLTQRASELSDWAAVADYATQSTAIAHELDELDSYVPSAEEQSASRRNADAMHNLCVSSDRADALEQTRELLRLACSESPQNFWYALNLSFVAAEREEWLDAVTALERALRLCPHPMRTGRLFMCWRDYVVHQAEDIYRADGAAAAATYLRLSLERLGEWLPTAERASCQRRLGDYYLLSGQVADAELAYTSISTAGSVGGATAGPPEPALAARLLPLLQDTPHYWGIDAALRDWAGKPDTPAGLQQELLAARVELTTFLDRTFKLLAEPSYRTIPMLTPIVFEIGDSLIPIVDSQQDGGHFLFELLPAMRQRVLDETGVRIPGVSARSGSAGPDAFSVQIDEVPRVQGTVPPDLWFVADAEAASMPTHNVDGPRTDTHPLTGATGRWLHRIEAQADSEDDRGIVSAAQFLVDHIEAVVRQHLDRFLGVQDTATLLESWQQEENGERLVEEVLPDERAWLRLTWLLRSLLREQVPITEWRTILEAVRDGPGMLAPLGELVRTVRLHLRARLPGAEPGTRYVRLPEAYEERLLERADGRARFTTSPQVKHEFLSWLRRELDETSDRTALVTRSAELRPLLREAISPDFPTLPVLSDEERPGDRASEAAHT